MAESEYVTRGGTYDQQHHWVEAKAFWLELGHLRALVAAAEGMPDEANVSLEGLTKSYTQVDRWHAKRAHVEHTQRSTRPGIERPVEGGERR